MTYAIEVLKEKLREELMKHAIFCSMLLSTTVTDRVGYTEAYRESEKRVTELQKGLALLTEKQDSQ